MKSNWLYDQGALGILAVLMVAMMLVAELSYRAGRRWHARTHDAGRDVFVAIKVSLLGLLALLLAFSFGMAADRYSERQRLVTDEANLLNGILLRSSLLPEPARGRFEQLFGQFVEARLAFFDSRRNLVEVEEAIDLTEKLHRQIWMLVKDEALRDPPPRGANDLMGALIDEWGIHRQRVHAFENRVPDAVLLLLFGGTLVAMAAVGFAGGIADHHGTMGMLLLAVLLGGTVLVILDLDRPRRGFFQISQEPILHVRETLRRHAEGRP